MFSQTISMNLSWKINNINMIFMRLSESKWVIDLRIVDSKRLILCSWVERVILQRRNILWNDFVSLINF